MSVFSWVLATNGSKAFEKRTFQIIKSFWALSLYLLYRIFHGLQMPVLGSWLAQVESAFTVFEGISTGICVITDTFYAFRKAGWVLDKDMHKLSNSGRERRRSRDLHTSSCAVHFVDGEDIGEIHW